MRTLTLTHGSPERISPKDGFRLFDYEMKSGKAEISGNGQDSFGPGIYSFVEDPDFSRASLYAGGGYVYRLKVNVDETIDQMYPETILPETWIEIVEELIEFHRNEANYNEDDFSGLLWEVESAYENGTHHAALEKVQEHLESIKDEPLDYADYDIDDYDDIDEWACALRDAYRDTADPANFIWEEVYATNNSLEDCINKSINRANNLWEVVREMFNLTAVDVNGTNVRSFNHTFQNVVLNKTRHIVEMTAAIVNDGEFAVIFDTDKISFDKTIDLQRQKEAALEM